ncbi:MAG: hypothetical protein WD572_04440 [Gammaproteobacteria bacterium]
MLVLLNDKETRLSGSARDKLSQWLQYAFRRLLCKGHARVVATSEY